ncbi:MAG: hypothetical protein SGPRY_003260 [Prymnesium sp.]
MSCGWIAAYMIPLHVLLRGNLPDSPARGVPLLLGCEVVNFLFILPIWPLQVLYGYLFGVVQGCLLAVCAYTISCLPPFFLAAPMLRALRGVALEKHGEVSESSTWLHWLWGKVCGWVARHDVVANIQDAVREQPFATTMALRLNLLPPAGLTSYALGACQIPSLAYALGSAIGNPCFNCVTDDGIDDVGCAAALIIAQRCFTFGSGSSARIARGAVGLISHIFDLPRGARFLIGSPRDLMRRDDGLKRAQVVDLSSPPPSVQIVAPASGWSSGLCDCCSDTRTWQAFSSHLSSTHTALHLFDGRLYFRSAVAATERPKRGIPANDDPMLPLCQMLAVLILKRIAVAKGHEAANEYYVNWAHRSETGSTWAQAQHAGSEVRNGLLVPAFLFIALVIVMMTLMLCLLRVHIRQRDKIPGGSAAMDFCLAFWCGCCVRSQLLRHEGLTEHHYEICHPEGGKIIVGVNAV